MDVKLHQNCGREILLNATDITVELKFSAPFLYTNCYNDLQCVGNKKHLNLKAYEIVVTKVFSHLISDSVTMAVKSVFIIFT